jgi:hypothetical protein
MFDKEAVRQPGLLLLHEEDMESFDKLVFIENDNGAFLFSIFPEDKGLKIVAVDFKTKYAVLKVFYGTDGNPKELIENIKKKIPQFDLVSDKDPKGQQEKLSILVKEISATKPIYAVVDFRPLKNVMHRGDIIYCLRLANPGFPVVLCPIKDSKASEKNDSPSQTDKGQGKPAKHQDEVFVSILFVLFMSVVVSLFLLVAISSGASRSWSSAIITGVLFALTTIAMLSQVFPTIDEMKKYGKSARPVFSGMVIASLFGASLGCLLFYVYVAHMSPDTDRVSNGLWAIFVYVWLLILFGVSVLYFKNPIPYQNLKERITRSFKRLD